MKSSGYQTKYLFNLMIVLIHFFGVEQNIMKTEKKIELREPLGYLHFLLRDYGSKSRDTIFFSRKCKYIDSIDIFSYICDCRVIGKRLYPDPCIEDTEAIKESEKTKIFLVLEKKDTLFILMNKPEFFSFTMEGTEFVTGNKFLPYIDSFEVESYYRMYYEFETNEYNGDIRLMKNSKDTIYLTGKKGTYIYGIIGSPYFKMQNGVMIGIDKTNFLKKMGINKITAINKWVKNKKDFTVVLGSIFYSKISWYYKYICQLPNYKNQSYCDKGKGDAPDFDVEGNSILYVFDFRDNKLTMIKFDDIYDTH